MQTIPIVIMAALRDVENLMLHQHPDRNNIYTNVQRRRLPFPCIQNPVIVFLYLDEGLQSGMTTVLTVTFESQERVRTAINYGSHRVIVRNPPRGLGGVERGQGGGGVPVAGGGGGQGGGAPANGGLGGVGAAAGGVAVMGVYPLAATQSTMASLLLKCSAKLVMLLVANRSRRFAFHIAEASLNIVSYILLQIE